MANKIKESNITDGAVTSNKIAPGTVSADRLAGSIPGSKIAPATIDTPNIAPAAITGPLMGPAAVGAPNIAPGAITTTQISPTAGIVSGQIAPGTIANDRLANTGITINGTTIALGASGSIVAGTDWQSVVVADGSTGTTAVAGAGYFIDTTSAAHTITLPADGSSSIGDTIIIRDYAGTFATNNVTLTSTAKISGADADGILSTNDLVVTVVYVDSTKGWVTIENEAKAVGANDSLITATGGTITESGDYRIHSFTGDGCFTISCVQPTSPGIVDYIVVAGGGGGGTTAENDAGGGGGAGGFREGKQSGCSPHTVSPLAATTGIPISATTYPVTVGAGGTGGPACGPRQPGTDGSNSVFSTITSTGGGKGATVDFGGGAGGSGGGGGGGGPAGAVIGGTGNTPPTSPAQGTNGGDGSLANYPNNYYAGGGGGATVAGTDGSPSVMGAGGNGASTQITGSAVSYAGGGSSGRLPGRPAGATCIPGGDGGGGGSGEAGTANTGGGGGAGNSVGPATPNTAGFAGGKGIVIIRYKYQ